MGTYDFTILTITLGKRIEYFSNTMCALNNAILSHRSGRFKLIVCIDNNDSVVLKSIQNITEPIKHRIDLSIIQNKDSIGIAQSINNCMQNIHDNDLVLKLDDDCKIVSYLDFFQNAGILHKIMPELVFSPFPVGLINNLGGPPKNSKNRKVIYYKNGDLILTLRPTNHVGGFARFAPAKFLKSCKLNNDLITGISGTEDGQFSQYCLKNNIEMAYLENGLIVEHMDSTLGQIVKYRDYFSLRSSESSMVFDIIEC